MVLCFPNLEAVDPLLYVVRKFFCPHPAPFNFTMQAEWPARRAAGGVPELPVQHLRCFCMEEPPKHHMKQTPPTAFDNGDMPLDGAVIVRAAGYVPGASTSVLPLYVVTT
jgi:hypothetical protein